MRATRPTAATVLGAAVVVALLLSIGFVWLGPSSAPDAGPNTTETPAEPSSQLGTGPVDLGGPTPPSPTLSFDAEPSPGVAELEGERFTSLQAALDRAAPGETVTATGWFNETVTVRTRGVSITSPPGSWAVVNAPGAATGVAVEADDVALHRLWVRDVGTSVGEHHAAIRITGRNLHVTQSRLTNVTFGIWGERADHVTVRNSTVVGRAATSQRRTRGDAVHLWRTAGPVVEANRITGVRDGLHYAWVTGGHSTGNRVWDVRYGLNLFYAADHRIRANADFNNDVGLVVLHSHRIAVTDNRFVNNTGRSGHGIILNSLGGSHIENNTILSNEDGIYVDNSVGNLLAANNISYNGHGIVLDSEKNTLVRNRITHNRFGAILVRPTTGDRVNRLLANNTVSDNGRDVYLADW